MNMMSRLQAIAMISAVRAFTHTSTTVLLSKSTITSTSSTFGTRLSSLSMPIHQRWTYNTKSFLSSSSGGVEPDTTVVATCTEKIKDALGTDIVTVTGAYDDPNGSHISIEVTSEKFEGKRAVQRQQMVYKAIWEEMQGAVHAVDSMICKAPSEV